MWNFATAMPFRRPNSAPIVQETSRPSTMMSQGFISGFASESRDMVLVETTAEKPVTYPMLRSIPELPERNTNTRPMAPMM